MPAPLKKLLQSFLVFLGCLHLVGGPHSMIQIYAWANMLVTYSQEEGLLQGTKDTFSGEKPCALCCKIAATRDSTEKKSPLAPLPSGLSAKWLQELAPIDETHLPFPFSTEAPPVGFTGVMCIDGIAAASPPVPPPRAAA